MGAHIGIFSLLAARLPATRVFAFEPSPRELSRFHRNVALNKFQNITIFPSGLGDKEDVMPLYLSEMENSGKNSVLNHNGRSQFVERHFAPLGYFIEPSILSGVRLCKIDVEGFEMSVLKGMAPNIRVMQKAVFVVEIVEEYLAKAGHDPGEVYQFFENYGYRPSFGIQKLKDFSDYTSYNEVFSKTKIDFLMCKNVGCSG